MNNLMRECRVIDDWEMKRKTLTNNNKALTTKGIQMVIICL